MELKEAVKRIEESENNDIRNELKNAYLCSAITFVKPGDSINYWEVGYYCPGKEHICTVRVAEDIKLMPCGKPFKEKKAEKINPDNIKIDAEEALEKAWNSEKEKYAGLTEKILIALHKDKKVFWSVSLILKTLSLVQIKINAETGKIIETKVHELFRRDGVAY